MTDSASNPVRVLIVDDEKSIADSLGQILCMEGYEVRCANSGEDALGELQDFAPQVIIADVILGGMDGVQLALLAAEILPGCSILLFSGQADSSELTGRIEQAGQRFRVHAKPIPPRVLLDLVEQESGRLRGGAQPRQVAPASTASALHTSNDADPASPA